MDDRSRFRIATWNLRSDRPVTSARADAARRAMAAINADVWVITEPWPDFLPPDGYRLAAGSGPAADLAAWPGRRWVAIWSRLPSSPVPVDVEADRMACARIESAGRLPTLVVGTVLPWRSDSRLAPVNGAAAFVEALHLQAAEWERLRDAAGDDLCVAGDFNQEAGRPLWVGTAGGLEALLAVLGRLGLRCVTADLAFGNPARPAIDHICVGDRLAAVAGGVGSWLVPACGDPPTPTTDHAGAYADLSVPG